MSPRDRWTKTFTLATAPLWVGFHVGCGGAAPGALPQTAAAATTATATGADVRAFTLAEMTSLFYVRPRELAAETAEIEWLEEEPLVGKVLELGQWIESRCALEPAKAIDEVLVTENGTEWLAAIRTSLPDDATERCARRLADPAKNGDIAGHRSIALGDSSVVFVDGVLVAGPTGVVKERVRLAEDFERRIPIWMPDFRDTAAHAWGAVQGDGAVIDGVTIRLGRRTAGAPPNLGLVVHGVDVDDADWIASTFRDLLHRREADVTVRRHVGAQVEVATTLRDDSTGKKTAKMFEELLYASGRRLRTQQAHEALWSLAEAMRLEAEAHPIFGKPAFPTSAPLTQGGPGAWTHPTWQTLQFSAAEGHEFAYEIATDATRRNTVLRAEADLDGDGESSRHELRLRVDGASVVVGEIESTGDDD